MSWSLYRWVWQLEAPLFIGMPPAGLLNRCRLYVPARAVWGAVTAELAQRRASSFPDYKQVGDAVRANTRFTYLYPAERRNGSWLAWLPQYAKRDGLLWQGEAPAGRADGRVADRQFRRRLLDVRPGTAIDPDSDSPAEASLRETECIMPRWRAHASDAGSAVALVGYVFTKREFEKDIGTLPTLFLGGDTRYGLGRIQRIEWLKANDLFGCSLGKCPDGPAIDASTVLAHAESGNEEVPMSGVLEGLSGWDRTGTTGLSRLRSAPLWAPGSRIDDPHGGQLWCVRDDGIWKARPSAGHLK
ncbi:MAG: hypothetical protein ACFCUO_10805 [Rhodospirillales bacterium]